MVQVCAVCFDRVKNKTPRITSEGFILKRMESTYFLLAVFFLAVFFLVAMNDLLSRK